MPISWRFAIVIFAAFTLGPGCASTAIFHSRSDLSDGGLAYYLPKTLLTIQVTAIGYGKGTVVKELTTEEVLKADTDGAVFVRAKVDGKMQRVLVNKTGALARDHLVSLKFGTVETENVADVAFSYVLQYQPSIASADRICAGVTQDSLLQYVEAASKDETGNIIVSLGKLVGRTAGPQAFADASVAKALPRSFKFQVDPSNENDIKAFDQALNAHFPELRGQFKLHVEGINRFGSAHERYHCPENMICYRTRVPVRIGLSQRGARLTSLAYVEVVDRSKVHTYDVSRAFLVEKLTRLGFRNGVLDYAIVKKPSEALAAANLPLTVYDAVLTSALAAPGRFLGEITPGMDAGEVLAILQNQQLAVKATSDLQVQLEQLRNDRNDGEALGEPVETEEKLKLSCARPKDPT